MDNTMKQYPIGTISQLVEDSFSTAMKKGWHDPEHPRTVGELIALMHSELSEALEEYRDDQPVDKVYYEYHGCLPVPGSEKPLEFTTKDKQSVPAAGVVTSEKPCGLPIELADCIIRIADFCGKHGIDLVDAINLKAAYNKTRPIRHGGKKI
jgi:NTP pyrophosphatase (non-canonical NTP hydrolase)